MFVVSQVFGVISSKFKSKAVTIRKVRPFKPSSRLYTIKKKSLPGSAWDPGLQNHSVHYFQHYEADPSCHCVSLPREQHQVRVQRDREEQVRGDDGRQRPDGDESLDLPERGEDVSTADHEGDAGDAEDEGVLEAL